jgi:signal transduction histidine kinase
MRKIFLLGFIVALGLFLVGTAVADKAADTKALVEQGVAAFKAKGKDDTIKAIDDPKGPFVKDDLYLFVGSMDNKVLAHPFAKQLVGKDATDLKDPKGTAFFVKFKEVADKDGSGWVEYWWQKPGDKEPALRNTFIMKVPGETVYIGAGYYK